MTKEGIDSALASASGQTVVNAGSPLTRLNYFDGKFLRADDLKREQSYLRQLVQFSNQSLSAGVLYGLDSRLDSRGRFSLGPGLAMDSSGRTLYVGAGATFDIAALIEASSKSSTTKTSSSRTVRTGSAAFTDCLDAATPDDGAVTPLSALYVICIGHAESLCGTEDVYGRLCEDACVTATDRPLIVEGVAVRAIPLRLRTPLHTASTIPLTNAHLRSLVASAFYEDERHVVESHISREGLSSSIWCAGSQLNAVNCVPLAVVGRAGSNTTFFDVWTVRRERMEAPSRRYWAWRMAMRPWDVYLAQILQFQCQLHSLLDGVTDGNSSGPCEPQQQALNQASEYLREFNDSYARHIEALTSLGTAAEANRSTDAAFRLQGGLADLAKVRANIEGALRTAIGRAKSRVLINGGIVELPSAGYLPIALGTTTVNDQVRRLIGEGVNLRYCIVRPDYVPHALEEAQHMDRISLIAGLDDIRARPDVDILVPNGEVESRPVANIAGFDTQVTLLPALGASLGGVNGGLSAVSTERRVLSAHGAGRADTASGFAFHFAGAQEAETTDQVMGFANSVKDFVGATTRRRETILRASMRTATNAPIARDAVSSSTLLNSISMRPGLRAALGETAAPKPVLGVWVTMRSERDPFALGVADSTQVSMEFAMTSQSTTAAGVVNHTMIRVRAFATLNVSQSALSGGNGTRMSGQLSGTFTTQFLLEGQDSVEKTRPFEMDYVLLRSGNASSGTLRVQLGNADSQFQWIAESSWGGSPLEVSLKLSIVPGARLQAAGQAQPIAVLAASALASSNALGEGNALRLLSTAALEMLGEQLTRAKQNGTAFVDVAERLLFPPAPAATDDLIVRPTLDWVLFQRRRTKHCATVTTTPAPTPPRRYQLFTVRAKSQREVDLIRKFLQGSTEFTPKLQRVDTVEFAGGQPVLVTSVDALQNDWKAAQPGNTLVFAAAATDVAADATLTGPRLTRVVRALASVTPLDPSADQDVLSRVPEILAVPGTDGVIVLITMDVVQQSFQNIFRVTLDERAKALLRKNQLDEIIKLPVTESLGVFAFPGTSDEFDPTVAADLSRAFDSRGGGLPTLVFSYAKPNDTSGGEQSLLLARAKAIARATNGGPNTLVEVHDIEGAWPIGPASPVITLVAVEPPAVIRNALVIFASLDGAHFPQPDAPLARVKFANNAPSDDELRRLMRSLTPNQPVGGIDLAVVREPIDDGAPKRTDQVVSALVDAGRPAPRRLRSSVLTERDRTLLERAGHSIEGMDEVIFLEPQGG